MQLLSFITVPYVDSNGGGTRYPDIADIPVLDWIEQGQRLVLVLDCDEAGAQALAVANAAFRARVVDMQEVFGFVWKTTRDKRDDLLSGAFALRDRHRDERELVALGEREGTTITEAQFTQLLIYIDALRAIPQGFPYPAAVVWPDVPEFINQ